MTNFQIQKLADKYDELWEDHEQLKHLYAVQQNAIYLILQNRSASIDDVLTYLEYHERRESDH